MPTPQPFDLDRFHQFERSGWEAAAAHYADAFGVVTVQTTDALLDGVGALAGTRLLDVACGPGFVAAAAAERGAAPIGIDFSAAMVEDARRRHPSIRFEEGDASALRFDDGSVDAVVMNFGMLHLARPEVAIGEAHRVLRPGGCYGFTVWAAPQFAIGFGMVLRAIETFGTTSVALPEGPSFFRFSDPNEVRRTLERAGFAGVVVRPLQLAWPLPSPAALFEAMSRGGVRTAAILRAQTPGALAAIREAVRQEVEKYATASGYVVPMQAVLAVARRLQPSATARRFR
jgi:ubiquinone/menaquinone biosynthesis C-methylase UbiE